MKKFCFVIAAGLLTGCATSIDVRNGPASVVIVGDGRAHAEAACPGSVGWGDAMIPFFKHGVIATNIVPEKLSDAMAMKPDFVIVALGQGDADAKTPLPDFEARLKHIASQSPKAGLVFVTPPPLRTVDPVSGKPVTNALAADAQPYADAMAKVATQSGATLVDLRAAMTASFKATGERANWFLHPPMDLAKDWPTNVRTNKQWLSPKPRNPQFFSQTGAESVAHWVANLLRAGDSPLKQLLRPVDGPPSGDFKLVWSDEFDGTQLNTNNWVCRYPGKRKDGINDCDCARIDGEGHLVIDIKKVGDAYHAAMITTEGRKMWTNGYLECRATLAQEQGYWSAFWLMSDRVGAPDAGKGIVDDTIHNGVEIDIFEYLQTQGDVAHMNLHWNGYGANHKSSPFDALIPDLRKEPWHVFGVDWRADGYTFYIDGRRAWDTKDAPSRTAEGILLSVEIGKWAGDISKAKLPQQVMIDWVRVWQR